MSIGDDLTWHPTRTGYVNYFEGAPDRLNGRLYYRPLLGAAIALEMLRIASERHFEACWPVCPCPRVCVRRSACWRNARRAAVIERARYALAHSV